MTWCRPLPEKKHTKLKSRQFLRGLKRYALTHTRAPHPVLTKVNSVQSSNISFTKTGCSKIQKKYSHFLNNRTHFRTKKKLYLLWYSSTGSICPVKYYFSLLFCLLAVELCSYFVFVCMPWHWKMMCSQFTHILTITTSYFRLKLVLNSLNARCRNCRKKSIDWKV